MVQVKDYSSIVKEQILVFHQDYIIYRNTSKEQVTGDIDKIVTTVSTNVAAANTTTHNLREGDTIKMNVIPNLKCWKW